VYEHEILYNFEKLYLMSGMLISIIITTIIGVYNYSRIYEKKNKVIRLTLYSVILIFQTVQFLIPVLPPIDIGFFLVLQCTCFYSIPPVSEDRSG